MSLSKSMLLFVMLVLIVTRTFSFSGISKWKSRNVKLFSSLQEVYKRGVEELKIAGIEEPSESARHLISAAANIGTRFSDFHENINKNLDNITISKFQEYIVKRKQRIPVQYIIENWDFYGKTFICREPILIPRQETEELVEVILSEVDKSKLRTILDVGCGSGVIGITLLDQLLTQQKSPKVFVEAIDINPKAVELSIENANNILRQEIRSNYSCIECSLEDYIQQEDRSVYFDVIVSNPPYIPSREIPTLQEEVRCFEDSKALDGGVDGLDLIYKLMQQSPRLLSAHGPRLLYMEVDTSHPQRIQEEFERFRQDNVAENIAKIYENIEELTWRKDLSGNPRFITIKYLARACRL